MIVKFLPSKSGGGIGSVNYVLNERVQQGTAKILKGDEAQTRAIISQISKKQKVCFGVLSFQESAARISDQTKQEIMADFERTLLGDFMRGRVNILWVQHEDKGGRLELNFIIPKIDLVTGTSFNPFFYSKPDLTRIDLWKKAVNLEYGFSDPDDPGRKNTISASKKDLKNYANVEALDKTLHELVEAGIIKSRTQMLELLRDENIQISRETKNSITVILPGSTKKNRLQGGIYADFKDARELEERGAETIRRIRQYHNRDIQSEIQQYRNQINELVSRRDEYNIGEFELKTRKHRAKSRIDIQQDRRLSQADQRLQMDDLGSNGNIIRADRNRLGHMDNLEQNKPGDAVANSAGNEIRRENQEQKSDQLFPRSTQRESTNGWQYGLHTHQDDRGLRDDDGVRRGIDNRKREIDAASQAIAPRVETRARLQQRSSDEAKRLESDRRKRNQRAAAEHQERIRELYSRLDEENTKQWTEYRAIRKRDDEIRKLYQDARRAVEQLFQRAKSTIGNLIEHTKRLILEQKEEQDREKRKRSGSGMGLSR